MQESQRRKETMRFFNMLNEPERTLAIANYQENYDRDTPKTVRQSVLWGFDWEESAQGNDYWDDIDRKLLYERYNLKTEPMEQQSKLDYMISVIQARKEGKTIIKTDKNNGIYNAMGLVENFNFVDYDYRVKPEPPEPKTEKFTFADAEFLVGLKVREKGE